MQAQKTVTLGKRYQFNIWRRLAIIPLALLLLGVLLGSGGVNPSRAVLLVAVALAVVSIYSLIMSYTLTLHPGHLRVENYLTARELPWSSIERCSPSWLGGASYTLHTATQKVHINAEIDDFPAVNEAIRQQLPQLWNDHHQKTFVFNTFQGLAYLFLLLVLFAFGLLIAQDGFQALLLLAFPLLIVAAAVLVPALRAHRSLTLSGRNLHLQPMLGEQRHYTAADIESISLELLPYSFGSRRRGKEYAVWLTLKDTRRIRLLYLEQGPAVLANVLRNWWQAHTQAGR